MYPRWLLPSPSVVSGAYFVEYLAGLLTRSRVRRPALPVGQRAQGPQSKVGPKG